MCVVSEPRFSNIVDSKFDLTDCQGLRTTKVNMSIRLDPNILGCIRYLNIVKPSKHLASSVNIRYHPVALQE